MLDVHIRHHFDSHIQQDLHVLPAFGALRTRYIRVCQFIDNTNGRASRKDSRDIHLLKRAAPINNHASGDNFKPVSLRYRVFASMGLEVTNDNILALPFELLCFL